jgi:hypothetical protein
MKNIRDYLHLYLNSNISCVVNTFSDHTEPLNVVNFNILYDGGYKPILRPLSSMAEEEFEEFKKHSDNDFSKMTVIDSMSIDGDYTRLCHSAFAQQYLLSKGFDLFGLIESGLAIEQKN